MLIGTLEDYFLRGSHVFIAIFLSFMVSNIIPTRHSTSDMVVRMEKGGGDGQVSGGGADGGTGGEDKKKCEKGGGELNIS